MWHILSHSPSSHILFCIAYHLIFLLYFRISCFESALCETSLKFTVNLHAVSIKFSLVLIANAVSSIGYPRYISWIKSFSLKWIQRHLGVQIPSKLLGFKIKLSLWIQASLLKCYKTVKVLKKMLSYLIVDTVLLVSVQHNWNNFAVFVISW